MKNISKLFKIALVAIFATTTISCNNDDDNAAQSNTIAAVASRNANLTSLVAALQRADLVETLDQTGPYTVFAPTNDAFATFLEDNGFDTLNDVPVALLREVLLNHVISGTTLSSGLTTGYIKTLGKGSASTTNTLSMFVNTAAGVRLNGVSSVIIADVAASNGVVHVVDAVIGLPTVVTHAAANPAFETLVTVVTSTDTNGNGFGDQTAVATALTTNTTPLTVFAPTNAAFTAATTGSGFAVGATPAQVSKVLQYHVTSAGNVLFSSLTNGQVVPMITNPIQNITIDLSTPTSPKISDTSTTQANIIVVDVQCENGIIHAVDKVLQPTL